MLLTGGNIEHCTERKIIGKHFALFAVTQQHKCTGKKQSRAQQRSQMVKVRPGKLQIYPTNLALSTLLLERAARKLKFWNFGTFWHRLAIVQNGCKQDLISELGGGIAKSAT